MSRFIKNNLHFHRLISKWQVDHVISQSNWIILIDNHNVFNLNRKRKWAALQNNHLIPDGPLKMDILHIINRKVSWIENCNRWQLINLPHLDRWLGKCATNRASHHTLWVWVVLENYNFLQAFLFSIFHSTRHGGCSTTFFNMSPFPLTSARILYL